MESRWSGPNIMYFFITCTLYFIRLVPKFYILTIPYQNLKLDPTQNM